MTNLLEPPIEAKSNVPQISTRYYIQDAINPDLWDKYTPYQLLIVRAVKDNDNQVSYVATSKKFTLPIPPQELSLATAFPTNIQKTLTGVSIQHGDAPFRDISLQGTTGITPIKNRGSKLQQKDLSQAIFAGTVNNFELAQTAAKRMDNQSIANPNLNIGIGPENDPDRIPETSTGYYQMRLLEKFLESYIAIKSGNKAPPEEGELNAIEPNSLRLTFCIWKDEAVYLVEPVQFVKKRSASSPMEYMFQLQLKAYARIKLDITGSIESNHEFVGRKPNEIAQLLTRLNAASEVISKLNDTLRSVVSDPVDILNDSIRQTSLFMAQVGGIRATLNNFPEEVQTEVQGAVASDWGRLRSLFTVSSDLDRALSTGSELNSTQKAEFEEKVSSKATPESVRLSNKARKKIKEELANAESKSRADFQKDLDFVRNMANEFANKVGAGHTSVNDTYNLATDVSQRIPTESELDLLFALNEYIIILNKLAVSKSINIPVPSSIEYIAGLAEQSNINFKVPKSKFAVPFPYGATLERIALQYLGDANRWHEIATLNNLREPYVDELGFQKEILTNGLNDNIIVANSDNLHLGQTVWVSSNSVPTEKRKINNIQKVKENYCILTLDGPKNLNKFKITDKAKIESFLPNTVNSQKVIYIPSDSEPGIDYELEEISQTANLDKLLEIGGVDFLLTETGDLVITEDGDCRFAYGLTNIIQTIKLIISTKKGSLLQHPNYGITLPVGVSVADLNPKELIKEVSAQFTNDPTFTGIKTASIIKNGSVLTFYLEIGIVGVNQFIPITVNFQNP